MANYYCSSVKFAAFATWAATTAYTVGQIVKRSGSSNLRAFRCEVAGTSGGTEPTWSTGPNSTTNDNGITWRCISAVPSYGWDSALPTISLTQSVAAAGSSDIIFVDSNHDEITSGSISTNNGVVISVNAAGSVPPVKADYLRGAKCRITSSGTLIISSGNFYGLDFIADTGATAGSINACGSNSGNLLSDCLLYLKNTHGSSAITISSTLGGLSEWTNNTKIKFGGNASQTIIQTNVSLKWSNSPDSDAVSSDSTIPTALFNPSSIQGTMTLVRGVNLSGFTGTRIITSDVTRNWLFEDCLLADSVVYINGTVAGQYTDGGNVRFINCSRVTGPVKQNMFVYEGATQKQFTSFCVLSDTPDFGEGKQAELHRMTTTNNSGLSSRGLMLKKWNKSVSSLTATIRGVFFGASLPNKSSFSLDLAYPGNANDTLVLAVYDVAQRLETTATVSDSSDWTPGATARANSTSYAAGDFVKVASNPGKIFIKENSGSHSSAASEPGGFATATYGSTVTDGGVTWRCGTPFKLQAAFTPARAGNVRGQARLYPDTGVVTYVALNTKLEIA